MLVEVLLIFLVFFVVGGDPPPHENEAHYLCRLKHHWNPDWCAGDLFLVSADAQLAFVWAFGWLTRWLSLTAVAWLGRIVAWSLLAWAWQRLSSRLVPRPWFAVLTAALFITVNEQAHLAGEWIVGGVEGKCFAYAFVVFALRELLDDRWGRVWLLLGAAMAFHPLVGGWSALVCGEIWLLAGLNGFRIANFKLQVAKLTSDLPRMWSGIVGGALLALIGVVPALALTWGESADVVSEAARIYVFERLRHHLALLALPIDEVLNRVFRHAALLIAMAALAHQLWKKSPHDAGMRRIVQFATGAALLAAIGFVIEMMLWSEPLVAARLLRYYWFRLTDFAAPLAVALLAAALISIGIRERRTSAVWGLTVAIAVTSWNLAHRAAERIPGLTPPADSRLRDVAAWEDVCHWIAANTEPDALFLTPRTSQTFKWHAGRAEVVTRKDIPQDARSIVEWFRRYRDIHFTDERQGELLDPVLSISHLGTERVLQLADKYGFDYVVTDWRRPLWLPVVYPNVAHANHEYVVYRITKRSDASRNDADGR